MNHLLGGDEIWYGRINGSEVPKDIFPIYLLDGVELGRKWKKDMKTEMNYLKNY